MKVSIWIKFFLVALVSISLIACGKSASEGNSGGNQGPGGGSQGGGADTEAPSAPQNLQGSAPSESSITLSWDASTDNVAVTGYRVFRGEVELGTTSNLSYADSGLSAETAYSYTVSAFDAAANQSAASSSVSVTTQAAPDTPDTEAPSMPQNLQGSALSESRITLSWDASTDNVAVTGYRVFRDEVELGTTTNLSYVDSGLSAETIYSYTVSAFDATANESATSSSVSVTTQAAPDTPDTEAPSMPQNLQGSALSESSITLSWDASSDNIAVTGYRVFRDEVELGTTTNSSYADSGLSADTTYRYTVSAFDAAANESAASSSASVTTQAVPGPDPEPQEPGTVGPIAISQSTDDGYSWGHYGVDWTNHGLDLENIRMGSGGNQDRDYVTSLMFRGIDILPGKNILSAKIIFAAQTFQNDSGTISLTIQGLDPASQDTFSAGSMAQDRDALSSSVSWNKTNASVETPDIAAIIQGIVNDEDWQSGNAMGFVIKNAVGAGGDVRHNLYAYDSSDSSKYPQLVITYGDDLIAPVISQGSPSGRLSASTAQAELSVQTDEAASCRYQQDSDASYDAMANALVADETNQHTVTLTGLVSETSYLYFIRCEDSNGNQNETGYEVSFSIGSENDPILTLSIEEPAGIARAQKNVRTGVPFPKGLLNQGDPLYLIEDGVALPLQSKALSLWKDGTVRWLLLDTQVSLDANETKTLEVKPSASVEMPVLPIEITETSDFISVDTGPLQFSVPKTNGSLIHSASVNGTAVIAPPNGDLTDRGPWISLASDTFYGSHLLDSSEPLAADPYSRYKEYLSENDEQFNLYDQWDLSVVVEEQGPLHSIIRVSGAHLNDSGLGFSTFITRIHAYQGDATLKIDHTLVFTGNGNDQITGYGVKLPYVGSRTFIEGVESGTGMVSHLSYDTHNVLGGNIDGQARGYLVRDNAGSSLSLTLKDMAENYPKALVATATGFDVQLYPESAEPLDLTRYSTSIDTSNGESGDSRNRAAQGISKTDTFFLTFDDGAANISDVQALSDAENAGPLLALASPEWYSDARVMGVGDFVFDTSLENSERLYRIDRVLHVLADFMRFNQREQFNWFGMLNYGDIRGNFSGGCPSDVNTCTWSEVGRYGWSGNSGEPSNQLWTQFLRAPSRALFTDAAALARHTQDMQMVHYGDATKFSDESIAGGRNREFSVGSLHRHGVQAWSGYAQAPEYSHIAGVETYYYLTGDHRAKEALYEAAAFIARYSTGSPSHTALVNGIDTLSRASAVFYDDPTYYAKFNDRLEVLLNYAVEGNPNAVQQTLTNSSLLGAFGYFVRGAAGLAYHHEWTGDSRAAELIFDAADIITTGTNNDKWGVGENGVNGSVWYFINSLTYAATIASDYSHDSQAYYDLVALVLAHNDHSMAQQSSSLISLASFQAIPENWRQWVWAWDEGDLDPANPALLHIARQMTFRNNFLQDYHSYRGFIHLATAAALLED